MTDATATTPEAARSEYLTVIGEIAKAASQFALATENEMNEGSPYVPDGENPIVRLPKGVVVLNAAIAVWMRLREDAHCKLHTEAAIKDALAHSQHGASVVSMFDLFGGKPPK